MKLFQDEETWFETYEYALVVADQAEEKPDEMLFPIFFRKLGQEPQHTIEMSMRMRATK